MIAVLGAHSDRMRAAWSVPAYLRHQGARLHPINPRLAGTELFGQPVFAHLGQLPDVAEAARTHAGLDVPLGGEEPGRGVPGLQTRAGGEGPYVFTEQHIKVDPIWNDNGTVTYKQRRVWHFVPDLSNGKFEVLS